LHNPKDWSSDPFPQEDLNPGKPSPTKKDSEIMIETWHLRLSVAGMTYTCSSAIEKLNRICEEHLHGQYSVGIVDLLENPQLARGDQILAIPTAVRNL
jgi:circadian clock protein KaiB